MVGGGRGGGGEESETSLGVGGVHDHALFVVGGREVNEMNLFIHFYFHFLFFIFYFSIQTRHPQYI